MNSHPYSIKKSRKILHCAYSWWKKKKGKIGEEKQKDFQQTLIQLEEAIFAKDQVKADILAKKAETLAHIHFKKTYLEYALEMGFALLFALLIAITIRQSWFELYEIPTGSMRPSFREQDRLVVTKTTFGINVPLQTKHFYFDQDLVKRGKIAIFSGDHIPYLDSESLYFGFLPFTKRYIKRLIGKPGDTLYFYGGNIYGIDKEGNPIRELLDDPWMQKLEHIPFLTFEGEITNPGRNQVVFQQMHQPIGRLNISLLGPSQGEVYNGKEWVKDTPFEKGQNIHTYSDFFGMRNFAIARLLTKEQLKTHSKIHPNDLEEGILYLQLKHTPNLTTPAPVLYKMGSRFGVQLSAYETIIPLKQSHIDAIMKAMYTARLVVQGGKGKKYSLENEQQGSSLFKGVPNGTYEFYQGKAEQVGWKGKTTLLPEDHPLYNKDPKRVLELFNYGIDMSSSNDALAWPHRYAYFREGNLYLMGQPILNKDDPTLKEFLRKEEAKEARAIADAPYVAFKDRGPPMKNGTLDTEWIKTYGIKVPEGHYLVLGDNHAMSADSRVFGFVPENNLEGTPLFILWPFGERWGLPPQTAYPFFNIPGIIVWGIACIICGSWYFVHRRKMNKRLFPIKHK